MSYIKDDKYHEEILNSYMKDVLLSSDDNKKNLPPKMKIVSVLVEFDRTEIPIISNNHVKQVHHLQF